MDLALFLSVILFAFNLALIYYVGCVVASRRSGIPVPQTLIDLTGVAQIGFFSFRFVPWSQVSDMIVFEEWNEGTSYDLMAFAEGELVPERQKDKRRLAKLRLPLPGLRNTTSDTKEMYGEYCRFINAWRRHALEGGQPPSPASLMEVAERVDVRALSKVELDASWRAIRARY